MLDKLICTPIFGSKAKTFFLNGCESVATQRNKPKENIEQKKMTMQHTYTPMRVKMLAGKYKFRCVHYFFFVYMCMCQ